MSRGRLVLPLLLLLGSAVPAAAEGTDPDEGPRVAIQNRKHTLRHEFTVGIGTIPIDPYYKGLLGTFQYTFHFGPTWAWEVVSFSYSKNFWTSLREDLEKNWRSPSSPQVIPEVSYLGDSNLVFKPFYGKLAYLNQSLVYGEFFLTAGPAASWYDTERDRLALGLDVGFGFRVHLSQHWSTRFDVRYYRLWTMASNTRGDDVLFLQLGIALNLGGSR